MNKQESVCKSIFKSGGDTTSKAQFTKKWLELINRMEKHKANSFK